MDIEQIKVALDIKKSEDLFGFSLEPEYQCPKIDKVLRLITDQISEARKIEKDTVDLEIERSASSIGSDLFDVIYQIEKIGERIDALRNWGQSWKQLAEEVLDNNQEQIITHLESGVESRLCSFNEKKYL